MGRSSAAAGLVLLPLAALFVLLGQWQQGRAAEKSARIEAFRNAPRLTALPALPARPDPAAFTRVTLNGRFDSRRHVLVDNQVLAGRPGVHVLTPFRVAAPESRGALVLVNRGWLPQGPDRSTLPEIPAAPGALTISGHLAPLMAPGMRLGEPAPLSAGPWPQRAVFPRMDDIAAALGEAPYPLALYLDAASPGGFDGRDWQPVNMGPGRHKAYALQWYALAATAIAAWIVTALRGRTRT